MYLFLVVNLLRRFGIDRVLSFEESSQNFPQNLEVVIGGAATAALKDRDLNRLGAAKVGAIAATTLLTVFHCSRLRL
jgi:hypothetical protein